MDLPPCQIVPTLADRGKYIASEATFYRILREEKLLAFLASGPKTIQEIVAHGIIYGGHILNNETWNLNMSEKAMMRKHLERLEQLEKVKEENGIYYLN